MSGGHYDYLYRHIDELAERINEDIDILTYDGSEIVPDDILNIIGILASKLSEISIAAHDIEWYMSSDYGDDTLRARLSDWATWILRDDEKGEEE